MGIEATTKPTFLMAPRSSAAGKVQLLGLSLFLAICLMALFAPLIAFYDPKAMSCAPFEIPNRDHWLGCTDIGEDLFSQLLHGGRVSVFVGLSVACLSTGLATLLALAAGLNARIGLDDNRRKSSAWIDMLIMRVVDVALSLPFLPLVIVLGVYFGASIQTQIVVIALVMWALPVRELRAQILAMRSADFVVASRMMGATSRFIGFNHLVPALAPLIVPQFVRIAHHAILVEAALSFLGLGDPTQNSWGTILFHANGRSAFLTGAWPYWILPPGIAIALTVLSLALIGYGIDGTIGDYRRKQQGQKKAKKGQRTAPCNESSDKETALLSIRDLTIVYTSSDGVAIPAVRDLCLDLHKGECFGLVGASGAGKSSVALSVLRLLRAPYDIPTGSICLGHQDLLQADEACLQQLRRDRIGYIPQYAMNALNPVLTIGDQLRERLKSAHQGSDDALKALAGDWLEKVGLSRECLGSYPHDLSGGMRQRAVTAIALCTQPQLVIADEPTSGLDGLLQNAFARLLCKLQQETGLTILLISHNLKFVARHCDRLAVMHKARIVDMGTPDQLAHNATHAHTKALFFHQLTLADPPRWASHCAVVNPKTNAEKETLITLTRVSKAFQNARSKLPWAKSSPRTKTAVKGVSFALSKGEAVGLVGGSGAGKTTIARLIMAAIKPDEGDITIDGHSLRQQSKAAHLALQKTAHMVFQDPYQSLNNRMTIADLIAEPLWIQKGKGRPNTHLPAIREALEQVHLPSDDGFLNRLPITLSGGQRQRIAFARALVTKPALIIADEPTSMLDQTIQTEIVDLMDSLRKDMGTTFLLITHDVALAWHFCDRLLIMQEGRIVEDIPARNLLTQASDSYSQALVAAT